MNAYVELSCVHVTRDLEAEAKDAKEKNEILELRSLGCCLRPFGEGLLVLGETVGVVTLDGRPERLFVSWPTDDPLDAEGVRGVARIKSVEKTFASAFVALPGGRDVILPIRPDMPKLVEGGLVEIEIKTASRRDKAAVALCHTLDETNTTLKTLRQWFSLDNISYPKVQT